MKKLTIWFFCGGLILVFLAMVGWFQLIPTASVDGEDVLLGQPFPVQLSSAIDPTTVSTDTIYMTDEKGSLVPTEVKLSEDGRTVWMDLGRGEWKSNKDRYTLHISNDIKSLFGFSLRGDRHIPLIVHEELPRFNSDDELSDYVENVYSSNVNRGGEEETTTATEDSAALESSGSSSGARNHSETNNQVNDVEESDIVQTDGAYIYHVTDEGIVITDIQNPEEMNLTSTISNEQGFHATDLFLKEDTLVVLGMKWEENTVLGTESREMLIGSSMTVAYMYNVSDRTAPELLGVSATEGHLISARMINGFLYYVTSYYPNLGGKEPRVKPIVFNGEEYQEVALEDIARIPNSEEPSFTIITAIDSNNPTKSANVEAYVGAGGQMYMSKEHLYLAKESWENDDRTRNTDIYKFALDGMDVPFIASGSVEGSVLNQFSMDEFEGNFRIATTEGNAWDRDQTSKNHVYILDEKLSQIGHVGDLAPSERIYSARFMGEMIYMVTFREMDPLFVIDASDPAKLEVLGELKIPGVSTYLHPIDENHLFGIGVETKLVKSSTLGEEPIVRQDGMKISIFDVTDFHNPKETFVEVIGGEGTYSEALHNHKALTIHPEKPLYAFPINLYNVNGSTSDQSWNFDGQGAMVYQITTEGIEQVASLIAENSGNQVYENYEDSVQRSVYANGYFFTLTPAGIQAFDEKRYELVDEILFREIN
ncbi:beta-propeller domain-containing protein [Bacillus suaedae]|uniref:Beta-propeller domain-containing protein n=1 Tax=Halalkalibacter suaedae TaxID=2822140 RepID=A0A940WYF8_9BACI|nr:beta-propeller domain-containing protein [Bacillus suaedae]MBP3950865.1 beta-propeller domain-containing protein [Bacillus suaedae]